MSDLDDFDDLRKRLDKLREFNKKQNDEQVTDEQLHEKLRKLKGLNVTDGAKSKTTTNYFVPPKFKSDAEEADYLLKQLSDEVEVDNKFNYNDQKESDDLIAKFEKFKADTSATKDDNLSNHDNPLSKDDLLLKDLSKDKKFDQKELNKELDYLKNRMKDLNYDYQDVSKSKNKATKSNPDKLDSIYKSSDSEEDEEEKFAQIVKKFVDEAELEKATGISSSPKKEEDDFKPEKFDFCYICDEDAVVECEDCDDRFCLSCFKEFHQDPEYKHHKYKKFQPKK